MLDYNIDAIIRNVSPYATEVIWLGKASFLLRRLKTNECKDRQTIRKALELIEWQSDKNIIDSYERYRKNKKIK